MKINRWKNLVLIVLLITLVFYTIGLNSKHRRYVNEDEEQFIKRINNLIDKSKSKIDNIISHEEEGYIEYRDIELLMIYHSNLERSIFGFKKKSNLINKDIGNKFQKLWDEYNYEKEVNLQDISKYYEKFLERIDDEDKVIAEDDDIYMFESIYKLYNQIIKEISEIV